MTPDRLALDPLFVLGLVEPARASHGHLVLPDSSLPVAGYVAPERLGPLMRLHARVKKAWLDLLCAAHGRGVRLDGDEARRVLEGVAREVHRRDPLLAATVALVEEHDALRLVPRAPLQGATFAYPFAALTLGRDRSSTERLATVPLAGNALGDCGRLLGLVTAGVAPSLLAAYLDEIVAARPLWEALVAHALVVRGPPRRDVEPGTVVHLGHATLLANLGGAHVLVDPWLPPCSAVDAPPPLAPSELPPLAGIFLTHHHWDHVHAETLLLVDKRVPVYVPAQAGDAPLAPRTAAFLAMLGFADVRALRDGDVVEVGAGGRVHAAPFFGEDPTRLGYAGLCYALEHRGQAALVHVDSAVDAAGNSLVSTGAAARLRARVGAPLSPVFATRRQEVATLVEYTWEGLLRPSTEWVRPTENCDVTPELLADLCRAVDAASLALYSEGGAPWYPSWTNFLPGEGAALDAAYQYGWRGLDDFVAAARAAGAEAHLARPFTRYRLGRTADG